MVSQRILDLGAECRALDDFVSQLDADDWARPTQFWGWSTWDQVMHLHFVDEFGLLSLTDEAAFARRAAEMQAAKARGEPISQQARGRFGHLDRDGALAAWRNLYEELIRRFERSDPDARLSWFGPPMSLGSFVSARQMEVWAHGQDIYDLFQVARANTDRIWNICDLGVRTYGWSFRNRGLAPPGAALAVVLVAPSGEEWRWNDGSESGRVFGAAEDFALVVTQRRHVDDTALQMEGPQARRWMEIAQCFAGDSSDGPQPGERAWSPSAEMTARGT